MTKEYSHKSTSELHMQYRKQAQKITLTSKDGNVYYLFNWYGAIFLVSRTLRYIPNRNLIRFATPLHIEDWHTTVSTPYYRRHLPKDIATNLTSAEKMVANTIATQLKKDPLYLLTKNQKAHVQRILTKRLEHKRWMMQKATEFKERYKHHVVGTPPVPIMVLIELSALYIQDLPNVYKRIDAFHKKHIDGKKLGYEVMFKERDFLTALKNELEYEVEGEHMAMI